MGKKRRAVWNTGPLCLFWSIWKAKNKIAFEDGCVFLQKLKAFFVFLLWSESKLFIKNGPSTLIDLVGSHSGGGLFFVHLVWTIFCFSCKGVRLPILYILSRYFSIFL